MKIYAVEQNSEAWFEERRGKITGAKAKGVRRQARNPKKRYAGFWQVLAEKLAIARDGEDPRDRGHRLEPEAIARLNKEYGLNLTNDPGMWISDVDDDIGISPDGAEEVEEGKIPTYAAEIKALDSASHIRYIYEHRQNLKHPTYNPMMSVPNDSDNNFHDQAIQYFMVNEKLETLYFVLYDDRFVHDHLVMLVLVIKREDVAELIRDQMAVQYEALTQINQLVKLLTEEQ